MILKVHKYMYMYMHITEICLFFFSLHFTCRICVQTASETTSALDCYASAVTMERVHWIYMPFLLATLFTITGYVTGFPTPQINSTDVVTDLVEVQSMTANVSESSTAQPLLQYSATSLPEVRFCNFTDTCIF